MFDWEHGIAVHPTQGIRASSPMRGMTHGIFRDATETWGIFSSYRWDGHSKLHFVQRSEGSCLIRNDTSGI